MREISTQEKQSLYSERPTDKAEWFIEEIEMVERGEGVLDLTEMERTEMLDWENELGEELEKIYKKKIAKRVFSLNYFLTDKGREDLRDVLNLSFKGETLFECRQFIFENRETIRKEKLSKLSGLSRRSLNYSNDELSKELQQGMDSEGHINISDIEPPQSVSLLISTEKMLQKNRELREFKQRLKAEWEDVRNGERGNLFEGKKIILGLYLRKVNELIARQFQHADSISTMAEHCDLTREEKDILLETFKFSDSSRGYSRYDKFIYGADTEYNSSGWREQISGKLKKTVKEIESLFNANEFKKYELLKEKGLDLKAILKEDVSEEVFSAWVEEVLGGYGVDDKWKFITKPEIKSMATKTGPKEIHSGNADKSIHEVITVLLGHEIEGHVLQSLNSEQINLRLFQKMKGDRYSIFSEMGPMYVQNLISKEAFGFEAVPRPYYIQAMIKKLEGGNYLDCVKVYYESSKKLILKKKEQGLISGEEMDKELKNRLKVAVKSVRRLFMPGVDLAKTGKRLLRSRDTVYLEQKLIAEKLAENGLEKYIFLTGVNLETLIDLIKIGVIDKDKIQTPKVYSLKKWEEVKEKYSSD